jgi:type I restriction enzyme S subunit
MIKEIEVVVPDEITLWKFNSIIKPIFEKIKNNSKQIQSLSQTRDELLPRLMKGEVRVEF